MLSANLISYFSQKFSSVTTSKMQNEKGIKDAERVAAKRLAAGRLLYSSK